MSLHLQEARGNPLYENHLLVTHLHPEPGLPEPGTCIVPGRCQPHSRYQGVTTVTMVIADPGCVPGTGPEAFHALLIDLFPSSLGSMLSFYL